MTDSPTDQEDFSAQFEEVYEAAGRPAKEDVIALLDGGEVPCDKPGLHPLQIFVDFYRRSVARAWFEQALERSAYPSAFLKFHLKVPATENIFPYLNAFIDALLGPGHRITLRIDPAEPNVIFFEGSKERSADLTLIAETLASPQLRANVELVRKTRFFLSKHYGITREEELLNIAILRVLSGEIPILEA